MKKQAVVTLYSPKKEECLQGTSITFPSTDKLIIHLKRNTPFMEIRVAHNSIKICFSEEARIDMPDLPKRNSNHLWVLTLKIEAKKTVSIEVPKQVILEIQTY